MKSIRAFVTLAALAASLMGASGEAQACGGMFCDGGPQTMPVDQTGENILYAVDPSEGTVEAHIQIQYQGEASRFAWVLPVQSLPTFDVGSQPLFSVLLQGTVPAYGFSNQFSCSNFDSDNGGGPVPGAGSAGSGGSSGEFPPNEPKVVLKKQVGAFDIVVLQGGGAAEVVSWLNDNGYQQNPLAEPILQKYLEKNYLFAAVKLTGGAGVDEIHPLVVKYHGTEPCIPLELTAIAAKENMGVRAFLLGDTRWAPGGNYKHIVLNPARFDWPAQATNYLDVLTRGADSAVANGRAFVTEYAGPSAAVSATASNGGGVYSPSWSSKPFLTAKPEQVPGLLGQQGLYSCYNDGAQKVCSATHPLVQALLDEFLPAPQGISAGEFYSCASCYSDQIDQLKWDGKQFAALFDERIVNPGKRGVELLQKWPYLTRLFTTISPAEMTSDPEFHPVTGLPDVGASNVATRRTECKHTVMQLPLAPSEQSARNIALPQGGGWVPWTDEMPWVERIEELPADGEPIVLVNNTQKINDLIDAWNKSQGWPPPKENTGSGGSSGSNGQPCLPGQPCWNNGASGAGASSPTGGTGQGSGGAQGGAGGQGGNNATPPEPAGGGCSVDTSGSGPTSGLWLLGVAAMIAHRKNKKGQIK